VWSLKPERWASLLVQENYQEEEACDKRHNNNNNNNVKCTLVQALRLCTGRTAHRGSRGTALPFLNHGTRRGWGVSVASRPLITPRKTRYTLYRKLCGPQGRSGQVRKISPPTGIRSPNRPARSQSLYRLRYPAHSNNNNNNNNNNNKVNAGTSDIRTMNSYIRIVATQCSLGIWFISGI